MTRHLVAFAAFLLALAIAPIAFALPSGTLTYQYNNYTHINSNATTVVDGRAGLLSVICVNTKGATGNVLTVYDNASAASGAVIAVLDTTSLGCYKYDVKTVNGITILTATGTAADVTIGWR